MIEQSSGHVQIQFFGSKFKFSIFYNFFFPSPSSCRLFSASAGKGLKVVYQNKQSEILTVTSFFLL